MLIHYLPTSRYLGISWGSSPPNNVGDWVGKARRAIYMFIGVTWSGNDIPRDMSHSGGCPGNVYLKDSSHGPHSGGEGTFVAPWYCLEYFEFRPVESHEAASTFIQSM